MARSQSFPSPLPPPTPRVSDSHGQTALILACVQTRPPLHSVKIGEGAPSPIFTEGRGALYTGYPHLYSSACNSRQALVAARPKAVLWCPFSRLEAYYTCYAQHPRRDFAAVARETRLIDESPEMKIGHFLISTKPETIFRISLNPDHILLRGKFHLKYKIIYMKLPLLL